MFPAFHVFLLFLSSALHLIRCLSSSHAPSIPLPSSALPSHSSLSPSTHRLGRRFRVYNCTPAQSAVIFNIKTIIAHLASLSFDSAFSYSHNDFILDRFRFLFGSLNNETFEIVRRRYVRIELEVRHHHGSRTRVLCQRPGDERCRSENERAGEGERGNRLPMYREASMQGIGTEAIVLVCMDECGCFCNECLAAGPCLSIAGLISFP